MQGVLIDLDGVVYESGQLIPGADKVIGWLQARHIPFLFLTNTSAVPRSELVARLAELGIVVPESQILTPVIAARRWLARFGRGRIAAFVPSPVLADLDLHPDDILPDDATEGAACVLVGDMAQGWDFAQLNRAFRLLMSPSQPPFLGLGMSRYWRNHGQLQLDAGPFIQALEYATGREAWQLGKPVDDFFLQGAQLMGSEPARTLMIGDDVFSDIYGAQQAGMRTVLVRTGKFQTTDLERAPRPDGVLKSIAELPRWLTS